MGEAEMCVYGPVSPVKSNSYGDYSNHLHCFDCLTDQGADWLVIPHGYPRLGGRG